MIAVTGITGHSGRFLVQQLTDNRFPDTVRCLLRETSDARLLDNSGLDIEKCVGSAGCYEDLCRFVKGADTILHIAGIFRTPSLLKAVEEMGGAKHIILVHTSGIYSKYKKACASYIRVEQDMRQYIDRGMNITILRPTMIFGDMCDHNISKFIRMVDRFPLMPEIDHGSALIQPVNARDLGQLYYKAITHESLPELEYFASGERAITIHELTDMIGRYLGRETKYISFPVKPAAAAGRAIDVLRGNRSRFEEKVLRMGEDRSFSHEDAVRDMGYVPEKFEIGLRREVEEYLSNGRK